MKKIVKRIAAIAVISSTVMSLMASASAFTNSETVTNTTKIGTTSYTTKGTNDISTTRYSFVIDLSTYVSSPSSATANEIHTHWQVYDYWTGADIGTKQTEDGYNTNRNRKTCNECSLRDAVISVNEGEQDYENDFSS